MQGTATQAGTDFYRRVARHAGMEFVDLDDLTINPLAARLLSEQIARHFQMLPISYANGVVTIATPEPPHAVAQDTAKSLTGRAVRFVVAPAGQIRHRIDELFASWPSVFSGPAFAGRGVRVPAEAGGRPQDVTASVAAGVQSVLDAAEREASALHAEVEATAQQRATEILMQAERQGQRMLAEADGLARAHLEESRARLDAYAADRIQRIHAATERLLVAAEGLAERFEEAQAARRSLAELMLALGGAAEDAANEIRGPLPPVPPPPRAPRPAGPPQPPSGNQAS